MGGDDFYVSASNNLAAKLVSDWPDWTNPISIVTGPQGTGKTHLVNVWRARSGAACYTAKDMKVAVATAVNELGPVAIEDLDHAAFDEHSAFHLLNLAREHKFDVLLTGRRPPGEWEIKLPDLRSRLRSAALVTIETPDEALLRAVLVKLFADRQLSVTPDVVDYLLPRIERTMAGAQQAVAALDKAAFAERRAVTRAFAARVIPAMITYEASGETP
ncbi:MAG: DnaA/Hda family protein [Alphaproteobacteria bacterium]